MRKLTKAQESKLHTALCADDLLYLKYQYMLQKLAQEHKRLIEAPKQVYEVIVREENGNARRLMVKNIYTMYNGTIVEVEL